MWIDLTGGDAAAIDGVFLALLIIFCWRGMKILFISGAGVVETPPQISLIFPSFYPLLFELFSMEMT